MFPHRSEGKPVFVADMDDASVGVALVTLAKHGPAEVLAARRATLPIEDRSRDQKAAGVVRLLEECTHKLLEDDAAKGPDRMPHAIYAILRAPWTQFSTAHTEETSEEPQVVTKESIENLAKKALAPRPDASRAPLEAGVMQVFLNGYPTGKPLGKKARTTTIVGFESTIDPDMKTSVTTALTKLFPGRVPALRSGMRALLTVMHEHLPDIHRFVLLDIGGETSTCAIVRKEEVTQSATVPEGVSTILRRLSQGGLPEETLSLLRMLATDACSTEACKGMKDALARAEPELVRAFGEGFASLAGVRRLPHAAILFAPVELSPWLQEFFARIDFSQFTATMQPFVVETLAPEHTLDIIRWKSGVTPDTGVGIGAACVNLLEQST